MVEIDWSRCRYAPFPHQRDGVLALLRNPRFALFDRVGYGKSKQVIDAAFALHQSGELDAVVALVPGFARSVWVSPDPLLGEVAKHAWDMPYGLHEYHVRRAELPRTKAFAIVVTNYEFLRRKERLEPLLTWIENRKTWLVLDESWMIQNPTAQQTKAARVLSTASARVSILNATPGRPEQQFSQFHVLDPKILGIKNQFHFKGRYCQMGGFQNKKIVGYHHLEEFQERTRPYVLRRTEGVDLPPVLPPLTIEARLTPETWRHYKSMRDELIVQLRSGDISVATQAGTRVLRLSQILAGFIGGVEEPSDLLSDGPPQATRIIGSEKLRAVLEWIEAQELDKVVIWGRFRPELARFASELQALGKNVHMLWGQQKPAERTAAKLAFAPGKALAFKGVEVQFTGEDAFLIGHPAAGGAGINLAGANVAIYATSPWLKDRLQSEGRLDRPGQTKPVLFVDVVAVGPDGQKTVDHGVLKALREQKDIADFTASGWLSVLEDE